MEKAPDHLWNRCSCVVDGKVIQADVIATLETSLLVFAERNMLCGYALFPALMFAAGNVMSKSFTGDDPAPLLHKALMSLVDGFNSENVVFVSVDKLELSDYKVEQKKQ